MKRASTLHSAQREAADTAYALERMVAAFEQLDFRHAAGAQIEALLLEHQLDDAALAPYLHFIPGRYTRVPLHRQTNFEILALCWPARTRSPIHAHGDSRGFVHVYRGKFVSDEYTLVSGGLRAGPASLRHVSARTLEPGNFDVRTPTEDIHRFTSLDEPAVTLHVYAKPLERSLIFDRERDVCRLVESGYDRRPI